jgi:hypothetical protein
MLHWVENRRLEFLRSTDRVLVSVELLMLTGSALGEKDLGPPFTQLIDLAPDQTRKPVTWVRARDALEGHLGIA